MSLLFISSSKFGLSADEAPLCQLTEGSAPTQRLKLTAFEAGFEALWVPSAKAPREANFVVFPEGLHPASTRRVYDDSGFIDARLP